MILRIAHIGVAVKDIQLSNEVFSKIFSHENPYSEHIANEKVNISFFPVGESNLELLQGTDGAATISKFVEKKGEGMHHICLEVDDINYEMKRLKNLGFNFINNEPTIGGDGYKIAFLHPKSTNGVLIELCQKQ